MGGSDGIADNITIKSSSLSATESYQCAIYEYVDYSSVYAGDLIGLTEIIEILDTEDNTEFTLDLLDNDICLSADTNYYLVLRVTTEGSGTNNFEGSISSGIGIYDSGTTVRVFDDPLTNDKSSSYRLYIYCSYTVGCGGGCTEECIID